MHSSALQHQKVEFSFLLQVGEREQGVWQHSKSLLPIRRKAPLLSLTSLSADLNPIDSGF